MARATVCVFAGLFDGIESAQARVARRRKDHVGAFADLRQRDLFSFARIVPGRVSHADVVLNDSNVRIDCFRALLVTAFEAMYQPYVHPAEKTYGVRPGG